MNKWDMRFMEMAKMAASWSKDPSTGVGCVIADKKNRFVSLGFNGFPRGISDSTELLMDREEKLRRTIHAEKNAMLFATRSIEGCSVYVTRPPCGPCAAELVQSEIARVVFPSPPLDFLERWKADVNSSYSMFTEAGIEIVCL